MLGRASNDFQDHVHALHEGPQGAEDKFNAYRQDARKYREVPAFFEVLLGEFVALRRSAVHQDDLENNKKWQEHGSALLTRPSGGVHLGV